MRTPKHFSECLDKRMLGHKSDSMTLDIYADLFEDDLASIAERLTDRVLAGSQEALCV